MYIWLRCASCNSLHSQIHTICKHCHSKDTLYSLTVMSVPTHFKLNTGAKIPAVGLGETSYSLSHAAHS